MIKDKRNYEMVRIDIQNLELIDKLAYIISKSTQYVDIRLDINLNGSASIQLGTYIDLKEDNVPFQATAFRESKLTNDELLERLGLRSIKSDESEGV